MNLGQLISLHSVGALKVRCSGDGTYTIGGVSMSEFELRAIADSIGWVAYEQNAADIIKKADTFVADIARVINSDEVLSCIEITMQNSRISGTERVVDRYKLEYADKFVIDVISGMRGLKGKYAVFAGWNHFTQPVASFSKRAELALWIKELIES